MAIAANQSPLFQNVAIDQLWNTIYARLPDPDVILRLQGMHRKDLAKLETDDEIGAAMDTRRDVVVGTPWRLDPYEESQHKWLWDALAPHVTDLITGAWYALPYGYSVLEVVLADTRPQYTVASIQRKPMEWFEPRRDGTLLMTLPQSGMPVEVESNGKFILTRRLPTYANPFGEALLSRCYWPWFFRHNGWEFRVKFLGRFGDPLILGSDLSNTKDFVEAMKSLGYENYIGVGVGEKVSAVTTSGQSEFDQFEQACISRFQKTWLGQTLTTQMSSSGGSYAAANIHNLIRLDKKAADLRMVEPAGQALVNLLWAVNRKPGTPPQFRIQDPKGLDKERADRDKVLRDAGMVEFTEQYVLSRYDLEQGDFLLPQSPAPAPAPPITATASLMAQFARNGQRFTPDQELVERLAGATLSAADSPIPPDLVRRAIAAATSRENLMERLAKLYVGESADAFTELTERALFAADVLGYVTAQKRIGATDVQ